MFRRLSPEHNEKRPKTDLLTSRTEAKLASVSSFSKTGARAHFAEPDSRPHVCRFGRPFLVRPCSQCLEPQRPARQPAPDLPTWDSTREERCTAYHAIALETLSDDDIEAIRLHLQRRHALGSDCFRAAIEVQLARPAGPLKIGRPRKPHDSSESRT